MEDRFSAIRAAIGTAGPGDVVVITGRGHCDYMEYWDGEVGGGPAEGGGRATGVDEGLKADTDVFGAERKI